MIETSLDVALIVGVIVAARLCHVMLILRYGFGW